MSATVEAKKPIPYGRQDVDQADVQAVVEVLQSDFLTQGPAVEKFERVVASHVGARHAVAASNATASLHIACRALQLGPGDRLWTSPNTFVASANCALYCGATVDFVDIERDTYNMSVEELANKLAAAKKSGTLPKIVVPVHFSGQSCDMAAIAELARAYGFAVIEDASHAIGAEYRGGKVGACEYSDIAIFSFHPVKIITTGEGGMALTNREEFHQQMALLRTHGITREPSVMTSKSEGGWYYEQVALGHNFRMTDIQAALGASQMARLPGFVERRRYLAARYDRALAGLPILTPFQKDYGASAWHLYVIRVEESAGRSRREIYDCLRAAQIMVNVHYIPVHLQPYYRAMGFNPGDFPNAEWYYQGAISLPMYPALTDQQQDSVVEAVREALR